MEIVGIIIFLWIDAMFAGTASNIAGDKGYSQKRWFHACFWLPGITYILVAALPDMELRRQNDEMIELQKQLLAAINSSNCIPSADAQDSDTK